MTDVNITCSLTALVCILTIVFVVLKLFHIIAWSWIWVLSPLWISFIIFCILFFVFIILMCRK